MVHLSLYLFTAAAMILLASLKSVVSSFTIISRQKATITTLQMGKKLDIRPTLDDVERISKGQAAKRRGTGSRAVPHRLNTLERKEWDLAKKRRFLMLRGTGWRKERGDSPLANIYRNYCDAVAVPCINIMRSIGVGELHDQVLIDFSPLRIANVTDIANQCIDAAKLYSSCEGVNDFSDPIKMGWGNIQPMLDSEVIWRVPVFSIVASFSVRADARSFASTMAEKLAEGESQDSKERENTEEDYINY